MRTKTTVILISVICGTVGAFLEVASTVFLRVALLTSLDSDIRNNRMLIAIGN